MGSHRGEYVEQRVREHQAGLGGAYTKRRLPVELVWCQSFARITDAIASERQIKGWSRNKKQALITGDWESLKHFSKRRGGASKG